MTVSTVLFAIFPIYLVLYIPENFLHQMIERKPLPHTEVHRVAHTNAQMHNNNNKNETMTSNVVHVK